eukprot:UN19757
MSGGMRQILNLGLYDGRKRAYSLRRLNLSKMKFFTRRQKRRPRMARCCPHWPSTRPVPPTGKGSATLNWRRRRP